MPITDWCIYSRWCHLETTNKNYLILYCPYCTALLTFQIIWVEKKNQEVDSLIVSLLRSYEDDGMSTDPQLQHDMIVGAEHSEDTSFFPLRTSQLYQQTELIFKPKHKHIT